MLSSRSPDDIDTLNTDTINECIALLCQIIKRTGILERSAGQDERTFQELAKWVRFGVRRFQAVGRR
jgi:hypothetical protein